VAAVRDRREPERRLIVELSPGLLFAQLQASGKYWKFDYQAQVSGSNGG
jgi:hypothetical protein